VWHAPPRAQLLSGAAAPRCRPGAASARAVASRHRYLTAVRVRLFTALDGTGMHKLRCQPGGGAGVIGYTAQDSPLQKGAARGRALNASCVSFAGAALPEAGGAVRQRYEPTTGGPTTGGWMGLALGSVWCHNPLPSRNSAEASWIFAYPTRDPH